MSTCSKVAVALVLLVAATACGSDVPVEPDPLPPGVTPSVTPEVEIHVNDSGFRPSHVMVEMGTLVRWINDGPSLHGTRSVIGEWDSGEICSPTYPAEGGCRGFGGVSYGRLFSRPGDFVYHCPVHPHERGTVVVMELEQDSLPSE